MGVGSSVNRDQLNAIASGSEDTHVFLIKSFQRVSAIVDTLAYVSCSAPAFLDVDTTVDFSLAACDLKTFTPSIRVNIDSAVIDVTCKFRTATSLPLMLTYVCSV